MATQKFMGRGQLIDRLTAQLREQGMENPEKAALDILRKRGHVDERGKLTEAGKKRDEMTAEERAKDRASRYSGAPRKSFKYNPRTNRATKR